MTDLNPNREKAMSAALSFLALSALVLPVANEVLSGAPRINTDLSERFREELGRISKAMIAMEETIRTPLGSDRKKCFELARTAGDEEALRTLVAELPSLAEDLVRKANSFSELVSSSEIQAEIGMRGWDSSPARARLYTELKGVCGQAYKAGVAIHGSGTTFLSVAFPEGNPLHDLSARVDSAELLEELAHSLPDQAYHIERMVGNFCMRVRSELEL